MNTTIRIKANELNERILEGIKKIFGKQKVSISISPIEAEYDTFSDLETRMNRVEEKAELYTFSGKEFEKLTEQLLQDKSIYDLLKKAK